MPLWEDSSGQRGAQGVQRCSASSAQMGRRDEPPTGASQAHRLPRESAQSMTLTIRFLQEWLVRTWRRPTSRCAPGCASTRHRHAPGDYVSARVSTLALAQLIPIAGGTFDALPAGGAHPLKDEMDHLGLSDELGRGGSGTVRRPAACGTAGPLGRLLRAPHARKNVARRKRLSGDGSAATRRKRRDQAAASAHRNEGDRVSLVVESTSVRDARDHGFGATFPARPSGASHRSSNARLKLSVPARPPYAIARRRQKRSCRPVPPRGAATDMGSGRMDRVAPKRRPTLPIESLGEQPVRGSAFGFPLAAG